MHHERLEIALMGMEDWKGRGDPADALTLLRRQKLPSVGTLDECYHVLGRWAIARLRGVDAWDRQGLIDLLLLRRAQYGPVNQQWHGQLGIVVRISDKAANILTASKANDILPRVAQSPDYFACRMCEFQKTCWSDQ